MNTFTNLISNANRLGNALLYPQTSARKLIRVTKKHLNPNWLSQLEQAADCKIQWVSPQEIRFISQTKFGPDKTGQIMDGDWDDLSGPFEQHEFYQALVAVVYQIHTWPETSFYQNTIAKLKADEISWGCRTEEEFRAYLQALDELYQQVDAVRCITHQPKDPLSVNIGRHGDLLVNRGEHWLAIARLLELPSIPIVINTRHIEWVRFRQELVDFTLRQPNGAVYTPLLHPDLAWIPAQRGHERFELIRQSLLSHGGKMLDIGCNLGYFCHRFEDIGFTCTGIELDPTIFYFLEKLKRAANKQFQTINGSVFEYMQQSRSYEVVLAMAIFHHFVKTKNMLHLFKDLLARLDTRELYFQPPHTWDPQMRGAYWSPSPTEFVAFILEHSCLNQATYLGRQSGGRPIYRLTV